MGALRVLEIAFCLRFELFNGSKRLFHGGALKDAWTANHQCPLVRILLPIVLDLRSDGDLPAEDAAECGHAADSDKIRRALHPLGDVSPPRAQLFGQQIKIERSDREQRFRERTR